MIEAQPSKRSGSDSARRLTAERGELDSHVGGNARHPMGQPVPLSRMPPMWAGQQWLSSDRRLSVMPIPDPPLDFGGVLIDVATFLGPFWGRKARRGVGVLWGRRCNTDSGWKAAETQRQECRCHCGGVFWHLRGVWIGCSVASSAGPA